MKKPFLSSDLTLTLGGEALGVSYLNQSHLKIWSQLEAEQHSTPWSQGHLKDSLNHHHCIGLWASSQLIGYAVFSFVAGEAELLLFVLHKAWRGQGIAAAFLRCLLNQIKPRVQSVFLEVRESNLPAIYLYEACGFNQVGTRKGYYPSKSGREDALIYAMELD